MVNDGEEEEPAGPTMSPAPRMAPKKAPPPPPPKADSGEESDYDFVTESDSDDDGDGKDKNAPLDGRYLLVKKIGEGATASANLCLDIAEGNRAVILKNTEKKKFRALPKPGQLSQTMNSAGPMVEIAVLKKLTHVNVIRLYNVVDDPTSPTVSLVLEYANGGDLGQQIKNAAAHPETLGWHDGVPGGMHPRRVWYWCRDVVSGLAYMHKQGVLHRDIKPDNILLDTGGDATLKPEYFQAKLADFGASMITPEGGDDRDRVEDIAGTPSYMSPECVKGGPYGGFASDVWSLGMTMYHLLFGHVAYKADNTVQLYRVIEEEAVEFPAARMGKMHVNLRRLLTRMLDKDPAKRITLPEMLTNEWITNTGESPLTSWKRVGVIKVNEKDLEEAVQTMATDTKLMGDDTTREERTLVAGETLVRQGDVATEAFFVQEGTADVFLEISVDMTGVGSASEKRKIQEVAVGEFIGEVALVLSDGEATRSATVVASSDMRVTVIKKAEIAKFFEKDPESAQRVRDRANQKKAQRRRVTAQLKNQLELMLGMGLSELPDIDEDLPTQTFKKGSVITSQGDHSDMVWFISRGAVKLIFVLPGMGIDDAVELSSKKEGEFIGEMAIMLEEENRLVTCVATAPSEVIGIRQTLFKQLIVSNPILEEKMMHRAKEVKKEREEIIVSRLKKLGKTTLQSLKFAKSWRSRNASLLAQADSGSMESPRTTGKEEAEEGGEAKKNTPTIKPCD